MFNLADMLVSVTADVTDYMTKMDSVKKTGEETGTAFSRLSDKISGIGGGLQKVGAGMTAGITGPIIGIGVSAVKTAADFESQMNILGVAAKGTEDEMKALRQAALDVGSDTKLVGISASEAAEAMTNFYKAGLETEDIFADLNAYLNDGAELTGALRSAVDLAAASELDLGQASDAVAVAMATFGLEAQEADRIANSFVQTADASVADVGELVDALANVGPIAKQMGWDIETTNQALGILSERGIRGSEAGTALRSMMTNLLRPTDTVKEALGQLNVELYDSEGKLKPLPTLIEEMSGKLKIGAETTVQVGGVTAEMTKQYEKAQTSLTTFEKNLVQAEYKSGMTRDAMRALKDEWIAAHGSLEGFGETLGDQNRFTLYESIRKYDEAKEKIAQYEFAVAAAGTESGVMTEELRNQITQVIAGTYGMKAFNTLIDEGAGGWAEMSEKVGEAATAYDVGQVRTQGFNAAMEQFKGTVERFMIEVGTPLIENFLTPAVNWITEMIGKITELAPGWQDWAVKIGAVLAAAGPVVTILGTLLKSITALTSPIGLVVAAVAALTVAWNENFLGIQDKVAPIVDWLTLTAVPFLQGAVGSIVTAFQEGGMSGAMTEFVNQWGRLTEEVGPAINTFVSGLPEQLNGIINSIQTWIGTNVPVIWERIVSAFTEWFINVTTYFDANAESIGANVGVALAKVIEFVINAMLFVPTKLLPMAIKGIVDFLGNIFSGTETEAENEKSVWGEILGRIFSSLWQSLTAQLSADLGPYIAEAGEWIKSIFEGIPSLDDIGTAMVGVGKALMAKMKDGIISFKDELGNAILGIILEKVEDLPFVGEKLSDAIKDKMGLEDGLEKALAEEVQAKGAYEAFQDIGEAAGQGLTDGMENEKKGVLAKAGDVAEGTIGKIKGIFKSDSPSKVMFDVGGDIMLGIINGVKANESKLAGALEDVFGNILAMVGKFSEKFAEAFGESLGDTVVVLMRWGDDIMGRLEQVTTGSLAMIDNWSNSTVRLFGNMVTFTTNAMQEFRSKVETAFQGLGDVVMQAMVTLVQSIMGALERLPSAVDSIMGRTIDTIRDRKDDFEDAGERLISAMIGAMGNKGNDVYEKIKAIVQTAVDKAIAGIVWPTLNPPAVGGGGDGDGGDDGGGGDTQRWTQAFSPSGVFGAAAGSPIPQMIAGVRDFIDMLRTLFSQMPQDASEKLETYAGMLDDIISPIGDLIDTLVALAEMSGSKVQGLFARGGASGQTALARRLEWLTDFAEEVRKALMPLANKAIGGANLEEFKAFEKLSMYASAVSDAVGPIGDLIDAMTEIASLDAKKLGQLADKPGGGGGKKSVLTRRLEWIFEFVEELMSVIVPASERWAGKLGQLAGFTESVTAGISTISPAIEAMVAIFDMKGGKLAALFDLPAGGKGQKTVLARRLGMLETLIDDLMSGLVRISKKWSAAGLAHARDFADTITPALGIIAPAIAALVDVFKIEKGKLSVLFELPAGGQGKKSVLDRRLEMLEEFMVSFMNRLVRISKAWSSDQLERAKGFSDAVGKVMGIIDGSISAIAALADVGQWGDITGAVDQLTDRINIIFDGFWELSETFYNHPAIRNLEAGKKQDILDRMSAYVEVVGAVVGTVSNAIGAITALQEFETAEGDIEDKVSWLSTQILKLVDYFDFMMHEFIGLQIDRGVIEKAEDGLGDVLESLKSFSETVNSVLGAFTAAVGAFTELFSYRQAGTIQIERIFADIDAVVKRFAERATDPGWTKEAIESVKGYAEVLTAVGTSMGDAIGGLQGLVKYENIASWVDTFFGNLVYVIDRFAEEGAVLVGENNPVRMAIDAFSETTLAVGQAMDAAVKGLQGASWYVPIGVHLIGFMANLKQFIFGSEDPSSPGWMRGGFVGMGMEFLNNPEAQRAVMIFSDVITTVSNALESMFGALRQVGNFHGWHQLDLSGLGFDYGVSLIQGIIDGIQSMLPELQTVIDALRDVLPDPAEMAGGVAGYGIDALTDAVRGLSAWGQVGDQDRFGARPVEPTVVNLSTEVRLDYVMVREEVDIDRLADRLARELDTKIGVIARDKFRVLGGVR